MKKLVHSFYNMDTNAVELTNTTIDCEEVGNAYDVTNGQTWIGGLQRAHGIRQPCCPGKWRTS